jgi:hypothetical protein
VSEINLSVTGFGSAVPASVLAGCGFDDAVSAVATGALGGEQAVLNHLPGIVPDGAVGF